MSKWRWILIVLGVAGIVFIVVSRNFPSDSLWEVLLLHFGIAFLVAFIIGITVEEAGQKALLKLIKDNVYIGLQAILPPAVVETLKRSILDPPFIRKNYYLDLTISPHNSDKNLVKVDILGGYHVKNLTNQPQSYLMYTYIDDIIEGTKSDFYHIEVDGKRLDLDTERNEKRIFSEQHKVCFKKEVSIPPNGEMKTEIYAFQIMKTADHFVWSSIYIAVGFKLRINFKGLDLDVNVDPMHPIVLRPERPYIKRQLPYYECEIEDVILPFQGVEIRWKPKK